MKLIKQFLFLLGGLVVLGGCHVKPYAPRENGTVEFDLRCHYLLDEKYKLDQDETKATSWTIQLFESELNGEGDIHYDLFSHKGGGPLGAEWNSDGDLFFLGKVAQPGTYLENLKLSLDQENWLSIIHVVSKEQMTVFGIRIAAKRWQSNLKKIYNSDYPKFFKKEDLPNLDNQNNGLSSLKGLPLYFQFDIAGLSGNRISKGFAWGGGE